MGEEAVIVQIPDGLGMDDLIELKYDSFTSSIQLVPLDAQFSEAETSRDKGKVNVPFLKFLDPLGDSQAPNSENEQQLGQRSQKEKQIKPCSKITGPNSEDEDLFQTSKIKIVKTAEGKFECPHCDNVYTQKDNVQRHIKLNHENFFFECQLCTALVKNLKQHIRFKHKTGSQVIPCVICEKIFASKAANREHLRKEHGDITVPTLKKQHKTCPVCSVTIFSKKSLWMGHIFFQHMIPYEFKKCPIKQCLKCISKPDDDFNLKNHLVISHSLKLDKIFHCVVCPRKLLTRSDLEEHVKFQHPDKTIACPECGHRFERYTLMALHLFTAHSAVLRTDVKRPKNRRYWIKSPESTSLHFVIPSGEVVDAKDKTAEQLDNETSEFITNFEKVENRKTKYLIKQGDVVKVERVLDVENSAQNLGMLLSDGEKNCSEMKIDNEVEKLQEPISRINENISEIEPIEKSILSAGVKFSTAIQGDEIVIEVDCDTYMEEMKDTAIASDVQIILGGDKPAEVETDGGSENYSEALKVGDSDKKDSSDAFILSLTDNNTEALNGKTINSIDDKDKNNQDYIVVFQEEENVIDIEIGNENAKDNVVVPQLPQRRNQNIGQFQCAWPGCTKTFVQKCSVNYHIKNVHMAPKVACSFCHKTLSNEQNLKEHIRSVHERVGTECTWPGCGKILSSKRQMLSHLSKHSEKPQKCPWEGCTSVLSNRNVLRMHIRKVHKKVDPWSEKLTDCIICGIKLKLRGLSNHMKIHKGEKYLSCDKCGDKVEIKTFKKHLATAHSLGEPVTKTTYQVKKENS